MKRKVLLLTSPKTGGLRTNSQYSVMADFATKVSEDDACTLEFSSIDQLEFIIAENNVQIFDTHNSVDLSSYDVVYMRNIPQALGYFKAVQVYVMHHGHKVIGSPELPEVSSEKVAQMVQLALADVPVPDTYVTWRRHALQVRLEKQSEWPIVLKANIAMKGDDNFLVSSLEEAQSKINELAESGGYLLQPYIENDGDYRVLFIGDSDPLVFLRTAQPGSHLNNTSKGGRADIIANSEFDPSAMLIARKTYELTMGIAGVDVMWDINKQRWLVLETNLAASLSTGALLDDKAASFARMLKDVLKEKI